MFWFFSSGLPCFLCSLAKDIDRMVHAVVESVIFFQLELSHLFDADRSPAVGSIPPGVEMSENMVTFNDEISYLLQKVLVPYYWIFAGLNCLQRCVNECLGLLKFVGFWMLTVQKLSDWMHHPLALILPGFPEKPTEDLVAPFLHCWAQFRVEKLFSRELGESVPNQYLTVVNARRGYVVVLKVVGSDNVICHWLPWEDNRQINDRYWIYRRIVCQGVGWRWWLCRCIYCAVLFWLWTVSSFAATSSIRPC